MSTSREEHVEQSPEPLGLEAMRDACKLAACTAIDEFGSMMFVQEHGWAGLRSKVEAAVLALQLPEAEIQSSDGKLPTMTAARSDLMALADKLENAVRGYARSSNGCAPIYFPVVEYDLIVSALRIVASRPDREAVARIIEPAAWRDQGYSFAEWRIQKSLEKADEILSLLSGAGTKSDGVVGKDGVTYPDTPLGRAYAGAPSEANSTAAPVGEPEGLPFGIIDPKYASFYTVARLTAWSYGYAISMHGSFTRDLDLIAVPWTNAAVSPEKLIHQIQYRTGCTPVKPNASIREHGRIVWTLSFQEFECPRFVDFSIIPPSGEHAKGNAAHPPVDAGVREDESDLRETARLLDQWSEIPNAESFPPYRATMAFLGKENNAGWVWARQIKAERDFDAEQALQKELAMQCIADAEERADRAERRLNALIDALASQPVVRVDQTSIATKQSTDPEVNSASETTGGEA